MHQSVHFFGSLEGSDSLNSKWTLLLFGRFLLGRFIAFDKIQWRIERAEHQNGEGFSAGSSYLDSWLISVILFVFFFSLSKSLNDEVWLAFRFILEPIR